MNEDVSLPSESRWFSSQPLLVSGAVTSFGSLHPSGSVLEMSDSCQLLSLLIIPWRKINQKHSTSKTLAHLKTGKFIFQPTNKNIQIAFWCPHSPRFLHLPPGHLVQFTQWWRRRPHWREAGDVVFRSRKKPAEKEKGWWTPHPHSLSLQGNSN